MTDASTDRTLLRERAYRDSTNLRARQSIYAFREPEVDFYEWVLSHTDWPAGAAVLDVGCGPGNYLDRVKGIGLDLSTGMAIEARHVAPTIVGDVCALPVANDSIDRLLAPHMLYHAPDLDQAVSELRRVLRPGGVALVVTNSSDHFGHLVEQLSTVTRTGAVVRFVHRFNLENGESLLHRHFDRVDTHHLTGEISVPCADPVIRYAESCRPQYEPQLPDGRTWEETMRQFTALVEDEIAATGAWRTRTHPGVFVCQ